jgi:hypothetical protein
MSKTFSEKILRKSANISMSVFPLRICFIAFAGVSSRWGSKTLQKTFYKNNCRKFLQKNRQKIPNRFFSLFYFITFLGVSRWGEFNNTIKNLGTKSDQPWYFSGLRGTNQPRRGPSLFVWVPLVEKRCAWWCLFHSTKRLCMKRTTYNKKRCGHSSARHVIS